MKKNWSSGFNGINGLQRGSVTAICVFPDDNLDTRQEGTTVVRGDAVQELSTPRAPASRLSSRGRIGQGEGTAETSVASSAARPPARVGQPFRTHAVLPWLRFNSDDDEIRRVAYASACSCEEAARGSADQQEAITRTRAICRAIGIEPPSIKEPAGVEQVDSAIRRAACPIWWRRRLRVLVARRVESCAIKVGNVHRAAAPYCSADGLSRHRAAKRRNTQLLAAMQVVNELGETFSLEDLAATSTSNPRLRRNELMARVKGLETIADQRGDAGLFVTWTLPSRFHANSSKTGRTNPSFDGSTPDAAARYLGTLWARARAALHKADCRPYGLRVAEPHTDGTPHWHFLLFVEPAQLERVKETLRRYALSESPDEPGAQRHRVLFTVIDKAKGSATGYIAKYVSKNIDGHALDSAKSRDQGGELETSGDDAASAAERIRAWASIWGIRQFQFFGTPPLSFWRELRRVDGPVSISPEIESARAPADEGDYAAHVLAVGGVCASRAALTLETYRDPQPDEPNRYGERTKGRLRGVGVTGGAIVVITRPHSWTVLPPEKNRDSAHENAYDQAENARRARDSRGTLDSCQ